MKLKSTFFLTIFALFLIFPVRLVQAKKKLPPRILTTPKPYGAWVKPKLRNDRHALLLMLGGMKYAESLAYTLVYNAGPVPQGIQSYHTPTDGNTQKELVFGTCSGIDCVYHGNLNEMNLEVTLKLISGKTIIYRYQINP